MVASHNIIRGQNSSKNQASMAHSTVKDGRCLPHKVRGCSEDPLHQELQAQSEVSTNGQQFPGSRLHFVPH